jgi:hypothetical protein
VIENEEAIARAVVDAGLVKKLREANERATELRLQRDIALGWLAEAYDLADEAIPYAGQYFDDKWEMSARLNEIAGARAAMKEDFA